MELTAICFVEVFTLRSNRNVGSLKIFLINLISNSLAAMSSDVLRLCIFKNFVVLNCEVLSFNLFLELLSFLVTPHRFIMAFLKLFWIIWSFASDGTSFRIKAIFKLVAKIEVTSHFIDLQSLFWFEIGVLGVEIFGVIRGCSVVNLMLNSSLFGTVSKADSLNSVCIFWITSSRVFVILWRTLKLFLLF